MARYLTVKVRAELVAMLRRCKRPGEPLSDTFKNLLDPTRIFEREAEARERDKAEAGKGG